MRPEACPASAADGVRFHKQGIELGPGWIGDEGVKARDPTTLLEHVDPLPL